jgi:hypothetical protein
LDSYWKEEKKHKQQVELKTMDCIDYIEQHCRIREEYLERRIQALEKRIEEQQTQIHSMRLEYAENLHIRIQYFCFLLVASPFLIILIEIIWLHK